MDNRDEVRDFLTTRRGRITPSQANLPTYGEHRRVPGLRREEVALLAGVSADYYTRLERGNLAGVSESVLDALARALQLDEAERAHLFDLARAATPGTPGARGQRRSAQSRVRPDVQRILDAMSGAPAYVRNGRLDILAVNELGSALYAGILTPHMLPVNLARFLFLDPRATEFFLEWDQVANDCVATLRGEAGRTPYDRGLTDLVGELSTRSEEFRTRWARHNVRLHRTAPKRLHHPMLGDIELTGHALELPGDGLTVITYTVEPGSESEQALAFLASWSTERRQATARADDPAQDDAAT